MPPTDAALPQSQTVSQSASLSAFIAATKVAFFTLLTSIGAHVYIPLPPDGVPMTLQTLAVVMAAIGLRSTLGALSMALYLLIGALGAAVFAQGEYGTAALFGQTGGYLFGFILCQPVINAILRRPDGSIRGWAAVIAAVIAGHMVIFAVGVPWLAVVREFPLSRALEGGFYPFIIPMFVKAGLAVVITMFAIPSTRNRIW